MKRKKIMLILTENCNLRCVYCYEQEKQKASMDFATARRILDESFSYMEGYDGMTIELHGGEPFLNFGLMKEIDDYVVRTWPQWPVLFRTTTNGTLVHGEVQEWLRERKDRYQVMLSLDGDEPEHDANRRYVNGKGSFANIDLDFFTQTWEYCPVSMTVNERTLPSLAKGTIWMQEKGFDSLNAFQWATAWDLEKNRPILKEQLDILEEYYSAHPEMHMSLLVNYQLPQFFQEVDDSYRYCIDIDDPIECYDAKGVYAPCHGFTSFTMGSEEKAAEFADKSIRDFVFTEENICCGCRLVRLCRICFAANHMMTGDMQKQSEEICVFNRMCIEMSIRIQRNRIAARMISAQENPREAEQESPAGSDWEDLAETNRKGLTDADRKDLAAADAIEEYMRERWG